MLSVVIPIHNEEPSILPLYDRLTAVMERVRKPYEIIFVDDASTDRSFDLLANLVETDPRLKVIRLRRNFGQTAALAAGFDEAQGSVIISLDGDLQHAPEDIPALLEKIDEGYDIASGWRKNRLDNAVTRKIPSRIANWLMAKASARRTARFRHHIQGLSRGNSQGRQSVRRAAPLHPGAGRFLRRARRRSAHPQSAARERWLALRPGPDLSRDVRHLHHLVPAEILHAAHAFLREMGTGCARGVGGRSSRSSPVKKSGPARDIIQEHGPLMVMGALALVTGVILFCTGLLGEVLTRTYFESQGRRIYAVREIRTRREPGWPTERTAAVDGDPRRHFRLRRRPVFHPTPGSNRRAAELCESDARRIRPRPVEESAGLRCRPGPARSTGASVAELAAARSTTR